jgi:hypothetical protein
MKRLFAVNVSAAAGVFVLSVLCGPGWAITSKVTSQSSSQDFSKGKAKNVVIGSRGTLELGRQWERLTQDFNDVWSINSVVVSGGKIYFGTSPNGGIYRWSLGKCEEIYSARRPSEEHKGKATGEKAADVNESVKGAETDANESVKVVAAENTVANEHIFAMATDISGRLLAGISGRRCALCRLEKNELRVIFEPNEAKYIFAICVAKDGRIFLGTGPQGKIYELNSDGGDGRVIYSSSDKNILSLAAASDGTILAGTDTRGLVYRIEPDSGSAEVLYDSEQQEVTSLLVDDKDEIYAAATSAQVVEAQKKYARQVPFAGRPEEAGGDEQGDEAGKAPLQLKIANMGKDNQTEAREEKSRRKPPKPTEVSHIYKISREGFVTDVFAQAAVLFALAQEGDTLLVGTGNEAELYSVDPAAEVSAVIYKDEQASQITAVTVSGDEIYIGTANPAKLIKIGGGFAKEGTYTSDLVDASQPADWGKLQIEADIPQGCKVTAEARSGNVDDANDPTFSQWTKGVEVKGPVQLGCPTGRYCQYRLTLVSDEGLHSPVIREVAVASTVANLAPNVEEVTVERITKSDKQGWFEVKCKAQDDNGDTLIYRIDFRKLGRSRWIELAKDVEQPSYEWDGRTVEDGRYEIRVTASDERSNSPQTALTASRVSDPVVVDNTGPAIEIRSAGGETKTDKPVEIHGNKAVVKLAAVDQLSVIGELAYTLDSDTDWKTAVPDDLVYDTTAEAFTISLDKLEAGEHVLAFRAKDDVGNTTYKTVELDVSAN